MQENEIIDGQRGVGDRGPDKEKRKRGPKKQPIPAEDRLKTYCVYLKEADKELLQKHFGGLTAALKVCLTALKSS
jgi:hypothetical protein